MAIVWYDHIGTWIAALLTLAILSFLYRDNSIYKLAEHIFVGVATGYTIVYAFWDVFMPNLYQPLFRGQIEAPQEGSWYWLHPDVWRWLLIVPFVLGLFFFGRFSSRLSWLSRLSIAFIVGCYAGVNATSYFQGSLVLQAKGTFYALIPGQYAPGTGYPDEGAVTMTTVFLRNLPILLGVLASLTYFFFSKAHTGFVGVTARVGIYFLMAAFGASFRYTVMARVSLFIGRASFLYEDWFLVYARLLIGGS